MLVQEVAILLVKRTSKALVKVADEDHDATCLGMLYLKSVEKMIDDK